MLRQLRPATCDYKPCHRYRTLFTPFLTEQLYGNCNPVPFRTFISTLPNTPGLYGFCGVVGVTAGTAVMADALPPTAGVGSLSVRTSSQRGVDETSENHFFRAARIKECSQVRAKAMIVLQDAGEDCSEPRVPAGVTLQTAADAARAAGEPPFRLAEEYREQSTTLWSKVS